MCTQCLSTDSTGKDLYDVIVIVLQQNTEKQLEDLKELQSKLKTMSAEARDKDLLYNQLVCNFHSM